MHPLRGLTRLGISTPRTPLAHSPGMLARLVTVVVAVLVVVAALAPPADAQLTNIQVYRRVQAGVTAIDMNTPQESDSYNLQPETNPTPSSGGAHSYELVVESGGATAKSSGDLNYLNSSSNLTVTATFHAEALGTSPAASMASVDAGFGFVFGAAAITNFHVTGLVQTSRPLQDLSDFLQCQLNGTVLAGYPASAIPLNTPVSFDRDATIYPGETFRLECRATRGVSNGVGPETQDLQFRFTLELAGSTPTTSTTLVPLTKKQCRRACNEDARLCRANCGFSDAAPAVQEEVPAGAEALQPVDRLPASLTVPTAAAGAVPRRRPPGGCSRPG